VKAILLTVLIGVLYPRLMAKYLQFYQNPVFNKKIVQDDIEEKWQDSFKKKKQKCYYFANHDIAKYGPLHGFKTIRDCFQL
jgi:hypothetical protein